MEVEWISDDDHLDWSWFGFLSPFQWLRVLYRGFVLSSDVSEARLCCETFKTDLAYVNSNLSNIYMHIQVMRENIKKKASKVKVNKNEQKAQKIKQTLDKLNETVLAINATALQLILNHYQ